MKIRNLIACALTLLLASALTLANASPQPVKQDVSKEYVGTIVQAIEMKEAYKVDDAEYTVGLFSKDNLGSRLGVGSEGVQLSGLASFLSLLKDNPVASLAVIASISYFTQSGEVALAMFPAIFVLRDAGAAEGGGLAQEQVDKLMKEVSTKTAEVITAKIEAATKGKIDAVEFKKTLEEAGIEKGAIQKLEAAIKIQGEELLAFKNKKNKGSKTKVKSTINEVFGNEDFLKSAMEVAEKKSGMSVSAWKRPEDLIEKVAATTITTAAVTTDTGGNALFDMMNADEIGALNLQEPFIEEYCTVSRVSRPVFAYADPYPKNGDAGFTAENAPKSQLDVEWKVKTLGPKKVTAYEVLSEEAVTDIPQMSSLANNILLKKTMLKRQNGILFGDGTGNQPIGVASLAPTFDPTTWSADPLDLVKDPNLYDCIIAGANNIQAKYNYVDENEYFPNLVFLNPKDFAALKLKKNEFGMYLFPQFVIGPNKDQAIDNLTIISRRQIPVGKIMMGDFTKLRIINYVDYNLRMGYINDQLINNLFTMVGESRFFTLIKELDKIGFVYDTIANIRNGIAAA